MKNIKLGIILIIIVLVGAVFVLTPKESEEPESAVWGEPTRMTNDIEVNSVQFLLDGRILFAGDGSIFVLSMSEGDAKKLFSHEGVRRANMNRESTKIVLDNDLDIFIANPDGSGLEPIADDPDLFEFAISFTPDGEAIIFVAIDDANGVYKIRAMDPDGGNKRDIFTSSDVIFRHPRQSPDGSRISYFSIGMGKKPIIWIMDKNGENNLALTDPAVDGVSRQASWSLDSSQFVFSSKKEGDFDIWTMDTTGAAKTRITSIPGDEGKPVFSPDGNSIAFVCSDCNGTIGSDMYIISKN